MAIRKIIKFDDGKCNGCGLCVKACAEGAIEIINGKARLVRDDYCDGLGACLGHCPQGAILFEEREAAEFDHKAVEEHLVRAKADHNTARTCPGIMARSMQKQKKDLCTGNKSESRLANWPLQITLIPINAKWLDASRIVIVADCCGVVCPNLHDRYLDGVSPMLMGCPKLDDSMAYCHKLAKIFTTHARIKEVVLLYMEVPCCDGLRRLVDKAIVDSGRQDIVLKPEIIPINC